MKLMTGLLSITLAMAACGRADQDSDVKINNGEVTTAFPAVVPLVLAEDGKIGICTGTIVSANTVLTAAHCIDDSKNGGTKVRGKIAAARVVYGKKSDKPSPSDLAILIYPNQTFSTDMALPIAFKSPPIIGSSVVLVGYGQTGPNAPIDGKKRSGVNTVADIDQGFIYLQGKKDTFADHGDSGGPLLKSGKIVGVLSGGGRGPKGLMMNSYVDLNSVESRGTLRRAKDAGATIPGL